MTAENCARCHDRKTVKRSVPVIVSDGERGCEAFEKATTIPCPWCVPHPVAK